MSIRVFSTKVKCDRYHLLKPLLDADIYEDDGTLAYEETGNAFNGFNEEIILNVNYDVIKNSRICKMIINGMNNNVGIYALINTVRPIRNNKTAITVEPDAWMLYRDFGFETTTLNTIYESTAELGLPFYEYVGKYKTINPVTDLFTRDDNKVTVLMVYHQSQIDATWVYVMNILPSYINSHFIITFCNRNDLDSNQVKDIYVSPFKVEVPSPPSSIVITDEVLGTVYQLTLESLNGLYLTQYYLSQRIYIECSPVFKTCITDMRGAIIWQAQDKYNGYKFLNAKLNIGEDFCNWVCYLSDTQGVFGTDVSCLFTMQNVNLSFYADYYDMYFNLEKSFNAEKRQAQLDKQVLDGIGDTVASTLWHGTSSGAPKKDATGIAKYFPATSMIATAGAAIGGAVQTYIEWYATSDYNKKMNDIEDRQARMQYDSLNSTGNSPFSFLIGSTKPRVNQLSIDTLSEDSHKFNNELIYKYDCNIPQGMLSDLLNDDDRNPSYLSGDFEFIKMSYLESIQLNERFKHGVEFVRWK